MRNIKKVLALALVFAMAFTFTAGAASFTDASSIGANYVDDVNMLVELGVIGGYLYRHTSDEKKYSIIELLVSILLLTLGTALVVRPFFTELTILWILSIAVILLGVLLILLGILSIPEKKNKPKSEAKN